MRKTTGAEPSPRPPARLLTGGEVDRDDAGNPLEHLLDRAAALLSDEARQREDAHLWLQRPHLGGQQRDRDHFFFSMRRQSVSG